ncbi:hypothetical protein J1614_010151 [Plenodomus biglobosus]|nr:hypothetical protein J1614_010151 [Plenodomus biglobosus]
MPTLCSNSAARTPHCPSPALHATSTKVGSGKLTHLKCSLGSEWAAEAAAMQGSKNQPIGPRQSHPTTKQPVADRTPRRGGSAYDCPASPPKAPIAHSFTQSIATQAYLYSRSAPDLAHPRQQITEQGGIPSAIPQYSGLRKQLQLFAKQRLCETASNFGNAGIATAPFRQAIW